MAEAGIERTQGETKRAVLKGLRAFNAERAGFRAAKPVTVSLRQNGDIVGGLVGQIGGGWFFISLFWIDEAHRGGGRGAELLRLAEDEARAMGATNAYVDTFSFQAPDFYQKNGYRIFGELENYPLGHSRFWLTKAL